MHIILPIPPSEPRAGPSFVDTPAAPGLRPQLQASARGSPRYLGERAKAGLAIATLTTDAEGTCRSARFAKSGALWERMRALRHAQLTVGVLGSAGSRYRVFDSRVCSWRAKSGCGERSHNRQQVRMRISVHRAARERQGTRFIQM